MLIGSYLLGTTKSGQLTKALNALVPDPCRCVRGGTPAAHWDEVLYFHYPDATTLGVTGTIGANLDTYVNQIRAVANYNGSITQLLGKLTNQR